MRKLIVSPDQDSYAITPGQTSASVSYGGGGSRFGRGKRGVASVISVQWTLRGVLYGYLMAFYRSVAKFGSAPFLVDLLLDSGAVAECVASIVPGSLSLGRKSGTAYIVNASLEVKPPAPDLAADAALVEAF